MPRLKLPKNLQSHRSPFASRLSATPALLTLLVTIAASSFAVGQTESILHYFVGVPHGGIPHAPVVADAAGNLYGTTSAGGTYGFGTVYKLTLGTNGKWTQTVLYSFANTTDGATPLAGLVLDAAGNLYGTASTGGGNNITGNCNAQCGSVFRLSPNSNGSWTFTVLYSFGGPGDGTSPMAPLVFDNAGNLYGTTYYGGTGQYGTVFELTPTTTGSWTETVLYNFTSYSDGGEPSSGVTLDSAGNIYGSTQLGGDINCYNVGYPPYGCGSIYKLTHTSAGVWNESVLHSFTGSDGLFPQGNVILDAAGNIYGTTLGGPGLNCGNGCGTVFKMSPTTLGGWTFATVYDFAGGLDGQSPISGLVESADGHFYGTTQYGGSEGNCTYGCGTVYELTPTTGFSWKEKIIHNFSGSASLPYGVDGSTPVANVMFDQAGNLYGTASAGGTTASVLQCTGYTRCGGTVFKLSKNSSGQWATSLVYAFTSSGDGIGPLGGVIADTAGNLYGSTQYGGIHGQGAVYEMVAQSSGGFKEKILYSFAGGTDGATPTGRVMFDAAGNLYGATSYGGANSQCQYSYGCGTVFELSLGTGGTWTETQIHQFNGTVDGFQPNSSLAFDAAGNLYGTALNGGSGGAGTAFELTPSGGTWTISVLHSFSGIDGAYPGPVIVDGSGNVFGVAYQGAHNNGLTYELSPGASGWTQTIVHTFAGGTDGSEPYGLAFNQNGALLGATIQGGNTACTYGCGTVYEIVKAGSVWQKKTIYSFLGGTDGGNPEAALTIDGGGGIYGTTVAGGGPCTYGTLDGCGTIFKLTSSSGSFSESVVYVFNLKPYDVSSPSQLLLSPNYVLYGTGNGGEDYNGALFQVNLNQSNFQQASSGKGGN